jgi:hypothetical protein
MNQFFIGSHILASGQGGGFTGDFKNISRGRNCLFTVYASGAGAGSIVNLEYESPFFEDDGVQFYQFSGLSDGYATPAFLTSPMKHVRVVTEGPGTFWVDVTYQN